MESRMPLRPTQLTGRPADRTQRRNDIGLWEETVMNKETFNFQLYSDELKASFANHADEIAISCLMTNHKVWKISFSMLQRWIEDFRITKEKLGLRDGDRVLVLATGPWMRLQPFWSCPSII